MAIEEDKIVRFPQGALDVPFEELNYVMAAGLDGKFKRISKNSLKNGLTIENGRMQSVAPGALPAGPTGQTRYMEVTAVGTWTYGGSTVGSNDDGFKTTFWWTGSTWVNNGSVRVKGDMPTDAVIKDELTYTNIYDKNDISGKYINTSTGLLVNDANSSYSEAINVVGIEYITILGRNATNGNIRFFDSGGNPIKPIKDDGTEFSNYSPTQNGKAINDYFKVPVGAVGFEANIRFNNTGDNNGVMIIKDKAPLDIPYSAYNVMGAIKEKYLPNSSNEVKRYRLRSNGDYVYVASQFNENYDIVTGFRYLTSANDVINIASNKLINKGDDIDVTAVFGLNGGSSDDASPINFNGGHLGGNHGYFGVYTATANSHGKSLADVGSVWQDSSGNRFYILQVLTANTLAIISENQANDDGWEFLSPNGKTLSFVSGGTNTSSFSVSSASALQLFPCIKNLNQKVVLSDGTLVTKKPSSPIDYTSDTVVIIESYDIIDVFSMVAKIVADRPVGGYTQQPSFGQGDAIITVRNRYEVGDKNQVSLSWTHLALKKFKLSHDYGTQNTFVRPSWSSTYTRMIPSSLPINDGVTTFDFRKPTNIASGNYNSNMDLTNAYWENGIAPIRNVDGLTNGSTLSVRFNIGIVPNLASSIDRNNKVSRAFYLASTRKTYPITMDNRFKEVYDVGDIIQGANFRGFTQPNGIRDNYYEVELGGKLYIFIDYSLSGVDILQLDSKWNDKPITIYNKSNNVKLSALAVTSDIDIIVQSGTDSNGFVELIVG